MGLPIGLNLNNALGNSYFPRGTFLKPGNAMVAHDQLYTLAQQFNPKVYRMLVWQCEANVPPDYDNWDSDPGMDPCEWQYIPITVRDAIHIKKTADLIQGPKIGAQVRFSVADLWEALDWINDGDPNTPYPDKPAASHAELLQWHQTSFYRLNDARLAAGTQWDLWNELVFTEWGGVGPQEPFAEEWIQWAAPLCNMLKWPCTVSSIIDPTGTWPGLDKSRAQAIFDRLIRTLKVKLNFVELHMNGLSNEAIILDVEKIVKFFQDRYGLPVSVGEIDIDLSPRALAALFKAEPQEVILWR